MSQSLSAIYIHAVFGTKFRQPFIDNDIEMKLHAYIAGILKKLDSPAIKINSMPDHIHILYRMSKNHSIAHVMEVVKKDSSKWMKTQGYSKFKWQGGYGTFSVSQSVLLKTIKYIENQKEHHKKTTLQKEVESLMKKYQVDKFSRDFFWS